MKSKAIKQQKPIMNTTEGMPWEGKRCFHVAVVGTMSSGKSTLIDALLGTDCMPSANLACTAKVISICQCGDMRRLSGIVLYEDGSISTPKRVTREQIKKWNQDEKVQRIILSGESFYGEWNKPVLVLHDTPGTNDARHPERIEQVLTFLQRNPIDIILFVIDGKYSGTDTQQKLAASILCNVVHDEKLQFLFLYNKLDCYNPKVESIAEEINCAKNDMKAIGYIAPIVLPVSAKAAKLFQDYLSGRICSVEDSEECELMMRIFSKDRWNIQDYLLAFSRTYQEKNCRLLTLGKNADEIGIRNAFQRTGISSLQDILCYMQYKRG